MPTSHKKEKRRIRPAIKWPFFVFLAVAFALYGNTLVNNYCLDDSIVIKENTFTKQGLFGIPDIFKYESFTGFFGKEKQLVSGGRYRPFSIATFAAEYQVFGLNPHVSHFINIFLYALTGLFIYLVLVRLLPAEPDEKWFKSPAFFISMLFLFHPVHTEVVANIKGRDELFALLFGLMAFWQSLIFVKRRTSKHLVYAALFLLPAIFSKEHAILFLVIIPLAILLFRKGNLMQSFQVAMALLIPVFIFLSCRLAVLGQFVQSAPRELMNNSFLEATSSQHTATVFYTFWKYFQLLVFPHPLTYDYYPYHIQLTDWSGVIPVLSLLIYTTFGILALVFMRRKPIITMTALFFFLPLIPVSNIFFPIGTFMSERFIYIPSLGFCLIAGYYLYKGIMGSQSAKWISYSLILVAGVFFSFKTITRNTVWKDDLTLFTTDVKVSQNSAKGNCAAGGILYDTYKTSSDVNLKAQKLSESIGYLRKAVSIHSVYEDAWLLLGNAYATFPDSFPKAIACYEKLLEFDPANEKAISNLEYVALTEKDPLTRVALLEKVLKYNSNSYSVLNKLGNTWGKDLHDLPKATLYLEKALSVDPEGKEALKDLGVAYAMQGKLDKALVLFEKVTKKDSLDASAWINLGLTYNNMKQVEKANLCFSKAKKLQEGEKNTP
jgi:protein O-mannosyl-transferase